MGTKTSTRGVSIDLLPDLHEELQEIAQARGKSVQTYVAEALESCIRRDTEEEDQYWGKMSEDARKKGFIGVEKSRELVALIKNA